MKVKINATIWTDIELWDMPTEIDCDSVGDFKANLDCCLDNSALTHLSRIGEDIRINSVIPYDNGVEEYGNILNNWYPKYKKQVEEFVKRFKNGFKDESSEKF